jgi:hypothetical protein
MTYAAICARIRLETQGCRQYLVTRKLAVMFMGCGEESGETETTTQIVKTLDDLLNCAQGKFAVVYYVMEEEADSRYKRPLSFAPHAT